MKPHFNEMKRDFSRLKASKREYEGTFNALTATKRGVYSHGTVPDSRNRDFRPGIDNDYGLHQQSRDLSRAAEAAAKQAFTDKELAFQNLTDKMKEDLRYAEATVNMDDDKLQLIGWGGRKAPEALQPPGQARLLEAPREGEGWIFLDWKAPSEGGQVASYRIERRERPAGAWTIAGMALETETTLHDQTRGVEWEYRVIAVNKAGEGEASNTVMVVL